MTESIFGAAMTGANYMHCMYCMYMHETRLNHADNLAAGTGLEN